MAADPRPTRRTSDAWSAERIAATLVPARDRLIAQLPREIAAARDLTLDQRELVVDDAIDYLVTAHPRALTDREELDRAFWAAASFRVKRAHEGRGATVRAGFKRAAPEALDALPGADDPEQALIERDERLTVLEFVSTLTTRERAVFALKYGGSGSRPLGRTVLARGLRLPVGEVRKAEREIARKLDRFITLLSAGALCSFRGDAIAALAAGGAEADEALAAKLHLKRCAACRSVYAEHARAVRDGTLPRDIAALLPLPAVEHLGRDRSLRDVLAEWLSRPFAGEPAAVATQVAGSGSARGLGTLATVKLLSLCLGGGAVTGGVCVWLQAPDRPAGDRRPPAVATATPEAERSPRVPKRPLATPTPTPTPEPPPERRERSAQGPAERAPAPDAVPAPTVTAVSPAPETAAAGGTDEFGPSSATTKSTAPAAPAAGTEFP